MASDYINNLLGIKNLDDLIYREGSGGLVNISSTLSDVGSLVTAAVLDSRFNSPVSSTKATSFISISPTNEAIIICPNDENVLAKEPAENELISLREELKQTKQEMRALQRTHTKLEEKLEAERVQQLEVIALLRENFMQLKSSLASAHDEAKSYRRQLEISETTYTVLVKEVEGLSDQLKHAHETNNGLLSELEEARNDNEKLLTRLRLSKEISVAAQVQLDDAKFEVEVLKSIISPREVSPNLSPIFTTPTKEPLNASYLAASRSLLGQEGLFDNNAFKKSVEDFYVKYNPSKIPEIPRLLAKYEGRPSELIDNLERKYSASFAKTDSSFQSPKARGCEREINTEISRAVKKTSRIGQLSEKLKYLGMSWL